MISPERAIEILAEMAPTMLEIDARACEPLAALKSTLGGADLQPLQMALASVRRATLVTDLRIAADADDKWVLQAEHLRSGKYLWHVGDELSLQLAKKAPTGTASQGSDYGMTSLFTDSEMRRDERSLVHLRPDFDVRGEPTLHVASFERVGKKYERRWSIAVKHIAEAATTPMPRTDTPPKPSISIKQPARRADHGS